MKRILVLCLALVLALSLAACNPGGGNGGNTDNPSDGGNSSPNSGNGGNASGEVFTIPEEKINVLSSALDIGGSKEAVIAEIPADLFKAIGELSYCNVQVYNYEGWKYTLAINMYTDDNKAEAELEKLIAYYQSVGGTAEKTGNVTNDYTVTFDYAESVSINALSSSIQIQFSVVKE